MEEIYGTLPVSNPSSNPSCSRTPHRAYRVESSDPGRSKEILGGRCRYGTEGLRCDGWSSDVFKFKILNNVPKILNDDVGSLRVLFRVECLRSVACAGIVCDVLSNSISYRFLGDGQTCPPYPQQVSENKAKYAMSCLIDTPSKTRTTWNNYIFQLLLLQP